MEPIQDPGPYMPRSEAEVWGYCPVCSSTALVMIERPFCSQTCRRRWETDGAWYVVAKYIEDTLPQAIEYFNMISPVEAIQPWPATDTES